MDNSCNQSSSSGYRVATTRTHDTRGSMGPSWLAVGGQAPGGQLVSLPVMRRT